MWWGTQIWNRVWRLFPAVISSSKEARLAGCKSGGGYKVKQQLKCALAQCSVTLQWARQPGAFPASLLT
jgi:hypothetical protein